MLHTESCFTLAILLARNLLHSSRRVPPRSLFRKSCLRQWTKRRRMPRQRQTPRLGRPGALEAAPGGRQRRFGFSHGFPLTGCIAVCAARCAARRTASRCVGGVRAFIFRAKRALPCGHLCTYIHRSTFFSCCLIRSLF